MRSLAQATHQETIVRFDFFVYTNVPYTVNSFNEMCSLL